MALRWSATEDRLLRRLYARQAPIGEIAERLGRSPDAVIARRRALAIPVRARARPWTVWEQRLLGAAIASGVPLAVIASRLDRSRDQVRARSGHLRSPRPRARAYLPQEDEDIRRCLRDGDDLAALAVRLGRSPDAIRLRAQQLGLRHPRARHRWEEWEDAVLRDGYTAARTCAEIAGQLPKRTAGSVAARAGRLGVGTHARRWSRAEDQRLTWLFTRGVPANEAALQLGRTPEAVRRRAARRQIAAPAHVQVSRQSRRWTAEEDQILRLHATMNPALLAQLLDRSDRAICHRLRTLGLREQAGRSPHYTGTGNKAKLARAQEPRNVQVIATYLSPQAPRSGSRDPRGLREQRVARDRRRQRSDSIQNRAYAL
jgi:hypothetical protein